MKFYNNDFENVIYIIEFVFRGIFYFIVKQHFSPI